MGSRKPSRLSATDLFCGAGGSSIGAEAAGVELRMGINHWLRAIQTHSCNFVHADHDCRDVSDQHPSRYPSTHLLLASPECTNYSQAKGRRRHAVRGQLGLDGIEPLPSEAEERSRATMWDVVRFAEWHAYEAIVVENVVDIWDWALLPAWWAAMEALGYQGRALFLNSMFFDDVPQSRDRVYVTWWKKGNRAPDLDFFPRAWCWTCELDVVAVQAWKRPDRRHGRFRQQYVYACPTCGKAAAPYVWPAAMAIDWSLKGERIGDRRKPLADATMARIQAGIERYWLRPVVIDTVHDPKPRPVDLPLVTQTGRQSQALYIPLLAHLRGTSSDHVVSSVRSADDPMRTVSAGGNHHGLVEAPEPLYVKGYTARGDAGQMSHPVSEPLGTMTAQDHHGLLVHPASGGSGRVRSTDEPMPTQVTETRAMLVQAAGNTYDRPDGGYVRARTLDEPLWTQQGTPTTALITSYCGREDATRPASEPMGTVTGDPRHALVVPINGGRHGDGAHKVRSAAEPLLTQTGDLARALVVPTDQLGPNRHNRARSAAEPLRTQTTIQADALVYAGQHENRTRPADEPLPTMTTGTNVGLVTPAGGTWRREATSATEPLPTRTATEADGLAEPPAAFLTSYYRTNRPTLTEEPMHTVTGRDRHALTEGPAIAIEDCFFRMLEPHEIQAGMAFPDSYAVLGNKRERVRQLGQAVTPPVLRWIVARIVASLT